MPQRFVAGSRGGIGDGLGDVPGLAQITRCLSAAHKGRKTRQAVNMRQVRDVFLAVNRLNRQPFVEGGHEQFIERRALKRFNRRRVPFLIGGDGKFIKRGRLWREILVRHVWLLSGV